MRHGRAEAKCLEKEKKKNASTKERKGREESGV
jgi:hypothetical protein